MAEVPTKVKEAFGEMPRQKGKPIEELGLTGLPENLSLKADPNTSKLSANAPEFKPSGSSRRRKTRGRKSLKKKSMKRRKSSKRR